jgi:hypothetical protein
MMDRSWLAPRPRRGGLTIHLVIGITAILITAGVLVDTGRLTVARHRDQLIADAAAMAAALKLPHQDQATAAADRILTYYRGSYTPTFASSVVFTNNAAGLPVGVRVQVSENVRMIFPGLMGVATRPAQGTAAGSRTIPSALLQGAVPLGVQYDTTFDLPPDGSASPNVITLKRGSGSDNVNPGNFGALRFPGDSDGANEWSDYLKWGYTGRIAIGDSIETKPGNMSGPTGDALVDAIDSRLNRAAVAPYNNDTWSSFTAGNPRVVVVPLVDWTGVSGTDHVPIHGFGAFWIDSEDKGDITGRFVRYTVSRTRGAGWDGISIDPSGSSNFDGGLWVASMTE